MEQRLQAYINDIQNLMDKTFDTFLDQKNIPDRLKESMLYSLKAGGKRLRPILVFASYEAYAKHPEKVLSTAAALEMIHTYSLIHDDLPAMDDDAYRRGKLTNHKMFDEATAILAGDALLTYSFELVASDVNLSSEEKATLLERLAKCSGPEGMVAGQVLDMEAENRESSLAELEEIHSLKTGELIRFAVFAGAYLGNASEAQINMLDQFAYKLGLLFQVQDDILDVIGESEKMGKAVGSDEGNMKSTFPKLLGIEGAVSKKRMYEKQAKALLQKADADQSYLLSLVDYFGNRDH
ncbi:polyprenyl synthetase family protein [Virgibacillus sp. 179-BFC.A HS]|uniref:Polyprenyl synthetase family protein n=1 Tax=Tigheibacillus jepli TaxID=3035914 RepID=A0ABU5CH03_9BACI|nr:farnesyl diphosphate synthase [Virgibacillus sp. 179-BFC.A HS]MDY0405617.1 polyprenyl synthetase family protein [Virgibacillus sp. 179-BFC.A HS]